MLYYNCMQLLPDYRTPPSSALHCTDSLSNNDSCTRRYTLPCLSASNNAFSQRKTVDSSLLRTPAVALGLNDMPIVPKNTTNATLCQNKNRGSWGRVTML